MLPDAPGRFSTTNGWPKLLVRCSLSVRARMSVDPPGAHGTIIVTGLSGHAVCALATDVRTTAAAITGTSTPHLRAAATTTLLFDPTLLIFTPAFPLTLPK